MKIDIKGLVRLGANLANDLTPDVQHVVQYHRRTGSDYDIASGVNTPTGVQINGIVAIITPYRESERTEAEPKAGSELVIICGAEYDKLVAAEVTTFDVDDEIWEDPGAVRQVVEIILIDPTRQVLKLRTIRTDANNVGQPVHGTESPIGGITM